MTGYIVLGMGFGILLQKQGYGLLWAFLMSLCIYAGSMQYVTIDLLGSGASLVATALMTLMVNIRHVFYGITMLTKYQKAYYFWISLLDQIYWVLGSLLGSIIGSTLPFNSAGVEFSMTALFVVIFVEQWEKTKKHFPALCGVLLSLLSLFIFGADDFPAMIGITIALLIGEKWMEKGETKA